MYTNKYKFNIFHLLLPAFILAASALHAQNAIAVSSNPGPGLRIALRWEPAAGATGYRLYRSTTAGNYPGTALATVQQATNCVAIRSLLITTPDSADWKLVQQALADSTVLFNPCNIGSLTVGAEKHNRLLLVARNNLAVAKMMGIAFEDNTVVSGTTYYYRIRALNAAGAEFATVATDLSVVAGLFVPLPAPAGLVLEPGDATVLARWNSVAGAAGYLVQRSPMPVGFFLRVNENTLTARVSHHLNGDTLIPNSEGFVDVQRWDSLTGEPTTHLVNGVNVSGPFNARNYYYRVCAVDLFSRAGAFSAVAGPVMPQDSTPPAVPRDILVTADDVTGHVNIRWERVLFDEMGRRDSVSPYRVYRYASADNPNTTSSVLLGTVSAPVNNIRTKDTTDQDPTLRSAFGDKTWWYRVKSVDLAGNESQYSAAFSATVKDVTAPDLVKGLTAAGQEQSIDLTWMLNNEPDMAGYAVYRSLCHRGAWVDCNKAKDCPERHDLIKYLQGKADELTPEERERLYTIAKTMECPCSGDFVYLGEITQDSAKVALDAGHIMFSDRTVPAGSPLCYVYWVKAVDGSGNRSGAFPIPSAAEQAGIVCERLRDRTPPEPALLSGLFARDGAIRVEWMGPPTQDIRAYHVYRAEAPNAVDEPVLNDYKWVGGMTVEYPPASPVVLTEPYKPPALPECGLIPVQTNEWMSQGNFTDTGVDPKKTYWYKVVGIDYDGNEGPTDRAAPISTFTFNRKQAAAPVFDALVPQTDPCGLVLQWSPVFDPGQQEGFLVYRSTSAAGPFTPVCLAPVQGNTFQDVQVVKGQTYWYRLAILMKNGRMSLLSGVMAGTP